MLQADRDLRQHYMRLARAQRPVWTYPPPPPPKSASGSQSAFPVGRHLPRAIETSDVLPEHLFSRTCVKEFEEVFVGKYMSQSLEAAEDERRSRCWSDKITLDGAATGVWLRQLRESEENAEAVAAEMAIANHPSFITFPANFCRDCGKEFPAGKFREHKLHGRCCVQSCLYSRLCKDRMPHATAACYTLHRLCPDCGIRYVKV